MKIIAERDRILSALSFVGRYAATNDHIPVLACVKFETDEHGVSVAATDTLKAAQDRFQAHVDRQGSVCLPSALLAKAIKSTDASEVLIDAGEKEASIQIGGKLKMKLPVLPATDFPAPPSLANEAECNFTMSSDMLRRHTKEVAFAQAGIGEKDRFYLQGTCWAVEGKQLEFCATDGKMLSLFSLPSPIAGMPRVIVPSVDLPDWGEDVSVSISELFIRFSCGHQIVATQLIEGSFPSYRRAIPDNPTTVRFDRAELLAAVNRMALVGQGRGVVVLFVGRDGKVALSSVSDGREIVEEVAYEGDDFQVAIAHQYISAVLGSFDCEVIEWRIADHSTPITLHNPRDESRLAIAFPYRDARIVPYLPQVMEAAE